MSALWTIVKYNVLKRGADCYRGDVANLPNLVVNRRRLETLNTDG